MVEGSGICEESEEGLLHLRGQPFGDAYLINPSESRIIILAWRGSELRMADCQIGGICGRGGKRGGGKGHCIFTWS